MCVWREQVSSEMFLVTRKSRGKVASVTVLKQGISFSFHGNHDNCRHLERSGQGRGALLNGWHGGSISGMWLVPFLLCFWCLTDWEPPQNSQTQTSLCSVIGTVRIVDQTKNRRKHNNIYLGLSNSCHVFTHKIQDRISKRMLTVLMLIQGYQWDSYLSFRQFKWGSAWWPVSCDPSWSLS